MNSVVKRNRTHLSIALFFFFLFLVPATYKIAFLKYPILSKPLENVWAFELKIRFQGSGGKDRVHHFLPKSEPSQSMVRENFVSRNLYFTIGKEDGNLGITWKGEGLKGTIQLFYRATVQTTAVTFPISKGPTTENYRTQVSQYLTLDDEMESITMELDEFLKGILANSQTKVDKARAIYEFLTREITMVSVSKETSLTAPLTTNKATVAQANKLFIHCARMAEIPARPVYGIVLEEGIKQRKIHGWAEVYLNGVWIPVDIANHVFAQLPETLLVLYRGDKPFLTSTTVKGPDYSYSVSKETQRTFSHYYQTATRIGSKLHEWSLFLLPLETQQVFRVILMIPLGALVVSLFRNIIGIDTFGTFMPVLIALAFRNTKLGWGLLLFSTVIVLGLISRWYMDRLKLLLVSRLSVIVTVVIIILAMGSILGAHVGVYGVMAIALFPMVIMTMTIERLSIILMERGSKEALKVSLGTLIVATSSYGVMSVGSVQDFFFAFPEVLFALIALQILIGRYTGYRLTEYFRFFNFVKERR